MEKNPRQQKNKNKQQYKDIVVMVGDENGIETTAIDHPMMPTVIGRVNREQKNAHLEIDPGVYGLSLDDSDAILSKYSLGKIPTKWTSDSLKILKNDYQDGAVLLQSEDGFTFRDSPCLDGRPDTMSRIMVLSDSHETDGSSVTTAEYLGSDDDPWGTYLPKENDLIVIASQSVLDSINDADSKMQRYEEIINEGIEPLIHIELPGTIVESMTKAAKSRTKFLEQQAEKREQVMKNRYFAQQRQTNFGKLSSDDNESTIDGTSELPDNLSILIGPEDQGAQDLLSAKKSYTVTDNRKWNRDIHLNGRLLPDTPKNKPTVHLNGLPEMPSASPVVGVNTVEGGDGSVSQAGINQSPEDTKASTWGEKLLNATNYLTARISVGQAKRREIKNNNKAEMQASAGHGNEKEDRKNERKRAAAVLFGIIGAVAIYKLGYDQGSGDGINMANWDIFDGQNDGKFYAGDNLIPDQIQANLNDTLDKFGLTPNDTSDQSSDALISDGSDTIQIETDTATDNAADRIDFSSDAYSVVPTEGWYQTFADMNIPESEWKNLLENVGPSLQEQGLAYPFGDGTWGISRSGTLSSDVLKLIQNSR